MVTHKLLCAGDRVERVHRRRGPQPIREMVQSAERSSRAAKAATAQGNLSNTKGVGGGVLECRIDFGPGYRVYFGKEGDALSILLGGGTKRRQKHDSRD